MSEKTRHDTRVSLVRLNQKNVPMSAEKRRVLRVANPLLDKTQLQHAYRIRRPLKLIRFGAIRRG